MKCFFVETKDSLSVFISPFLEFSLSFRIKYLKFAIQFLKQLLKIEKMRLTLTSTVVLLFICFSYSIAQKKPKESILATLGAYPVYLSEFTYLYEKSMTSKDSLYTEKNVKDYLSLFLDYKLKILDAQKTGIDTTESFKKEFATYEDQLANPYLTDKKRFDSLITEAYQRLKEEINASHLLVKVGEEAEPQDTLAAYQKIEKLQKRIQQGESFEELVQKESEEPNATQSRGNLGYFTALQMVYPFENAAYNSPNGKYSGIFRTRFGYHLLKVNDRRPNSGKVTVAHLMVRIAQENGDSLLAKKKIDELYLKAKNGENWDKLCAEFSDDGTSKKEGGKLPEFGVGTVIPSFEQAAFALKNTGDLSEPIRTPYGWHIIKLLDKKGVPSFKEMESKLRVEISNDARAEFIKKSYTEKLKKQYAFTENKAVFEEIKMQANEKLLKGNWTYNSLDPAMSKVLFTIKNKTLKQQKSYPVKDFFEYAYLKQVAKPELKDPQHYLYILYKKFIEASIQAYEKSVLPLKYTEYKMLLKEYKEGIMLFQLMTDKVWQKAIDDTAGCRIYFTEHRDRYRWDFRANAVIYRMKNEEVFNYLKPYLEKSLYPVHSPKINSLYFDKNDNTLNEESLKTLNDLVALLKRDPLLKVEISGHADPSEKVIYSKERIDPTVKYLRFKNIDAGRLITKDFGNTKIASASNRDLNRRIELNLFTSSKKELEKIINSDYPDGISITEGVFQKGENEFLDKVEWKPGVYHINEKSQLYYIEIKDLKDPRLKEYDEARGFVITDYQRFLEQEWLSDLKNRYPVVVDQNVVNKMIKSKIN